MNRYYSEMNGRGYRLTNRDNKLHAHFGHPLADFHWYRIITKDEDDDVAIHSMDMIHLDFPILNIPKPFKR